MACRTDDLVGEIEKLIESEPLAIPDPDASVAERVAEVLKHIVGRFAGLAPRARVRARSKSVSLNIYIPVYVLDRARTYARGLLITFPRCSSRTSLPGVVSEGVAEVETADGSDENAKCGDQQNLHDVFSFFVFCERFP